MNKKEILQKLEEHIHLGTVTSDEAFTVIGKAEMDRLKNKQENCNHKYEYVSPDGYGFHECKLCGKIRD